MFHHIRCSQGCLKASYIITTGSKTDTRDPAKYGHRNPSSITPHPAALPVTGRTGPLRGAAPGLAGVVQNHSWGMQSQVPAPTQPQKRHGAVPSAELAMGTSVPASGSALVGSEDELRPGVLQRTMGFSGQRGSLWTWLPLAPPPSHSQTQLD